MLIPLRSRDEVFFMNGDAEYGVLAFVPEHMRSHMRELESSTTENIVSVSSVGELLQLSLDRTFAVVIIPATGLPAEQWWAIWGCVNDMVPRPSILVYALRSDFQMWASVLESGGYDVIVAPFTADKLGHSIRAATAEFARLQRE